VEEHNEYRVIRADTNEVVWLSGFGRFLYDENGKPVRHIGVAFDSTGRKRMEEELRRSHDELDMLVRDLREKSENLEEVNAALRALLRQREEDRKELGQSVVANVRNLILPYTEKLKQSPLSSAQMTWMKILESHLNEIASSFGRTLAAQYTNLTSTEIRTATLVRDGMSTAQIAELSGISEKTVCRHRDNIRKKLGLRGGGINLRTHLLSLQ
jgi:DNA-binding NarL/FixJ family response regulator